MSKRSNYNGVCRAAPALGKPLGCTFTTGVSSLLEASFDKNTLELGLDTAIECLHLIKLDFVPS